MANISSYLSTLRGTKDGETIRNAIADITEAVNTDNNSVIELLGGLNPTAVAAAATTATTKAGEAAGSADDAMDSKVVATAQAGISTTKAAEALASKNAAAASEANSEASELAAEASELAAAGSATTATTKADESAASAADALAAKNSAETAKTQTQAIKDAAVLALAETTDEAEVIEARKGKASLGEKIGEIDTQLAETVNKTYGTVNIREFGGIDDGVTDAYNAYVAAKNAAGVGGTVIFPRTEGVTDSRYYFATNIFNDTANTWWDVAENVVIDTPSALDYNQKLNLIRGTKINYRNIGNVVRTYPTKPIKQHYIAESDIDKSIATPVLASQLVGKTSTWATNYSVTDLIITEVSSKETSVPVSSNKISAAGLVLNVGEALTANFSNPGSPPFLGGVLVLTADSYAFIFTNNLGGITQTVTIGIKKGVNAFSQAEYSTFDNYLSYMATNAIWTVERVSATSFRVLTNGVNVSNGIIDMGGEITFCGIGAFNKSFNLKNMVKEVNKAKGGIEPLNFTLFGDSLTAPLFGNWEQTFKSALDGSFGLRVGAINNKAVGGSTSTNQWNKMSAEGIVNADYVIIQIGTNDIQTQVPVDTYISNITSMVNKARTDKARVILGIPPLFYSKTFTNTGQTTSNYEKGMEYRGALLRYAAENNVKIVDLLSVLGVARAEFDILYDNIHPNFKTSELMGMAFAKAVLGDYLANKNNL